MIDTRQLARIAGDYKRARHLLHVAEGRAVKRAGVSVRAAQVKDITAELNLRAGTIRDELRIRHETNKASPQAVITVRQRGVPIGEFLGTKQTKAGVALKVLKGGPRALLKAAFGKDKRAPYFGRAGVGSNKYGSPHVGRLPIVKLFGPSVQQVYRRDEIAEKGAQVWGSRIAIELEREERFALKKAGVID